MHFKQGRYHRESAPGKAFSRFLPGKRLKAFMVSGFRGNFCRRPGFAGIDFFTQSMHNLHQGAEGNDLVLPFVNSFLPHCFRKLVQVTLVVFPAGCMVLYRIG